MQKNTYEKFTDAKLIKSRDLLKGVSIGFGIVYVVALGILIYLFATKGFGTIPFATLIPVFVMPVTFVPLLVSLSLMNKEIKERKL